MRLSSLRKRHVMCCMSFLSCLFFYLSAIHYSQMYTLEATSLQSTPVPSLSCDPLPCWCEFWLSTPLSFCSTKVVCKRVYCCSHDVLNSQNKAIHSSVCLIQTFFSVSAFLVLCFFSNSGLCPNLVFNPSYFCGHTSWISHNHPMVKWAEFPPLVSIGTACVHWYNGTALVRQLPYNFILVRWPEYSGGGGG